MANRREGVAVSREGAVRSFRADVGALRRRPGSRREVHLEGVIPELGVTGSHVPEGGLVKFDGLLESVSGGVLVTATVSAPFEGECRRCLDVARGTLEGQVVELLTDIADPDTGYLVDGDSLDLRDMAHDACILELPLAPLCDEACLGLCPVCGANRNVEPCSCGPATDPRWAALAELAGPEVSEWADLPAGRSRRAPGEKTP